MKTLQEIEKIRQEKRKELELRINKNIKTKEKHILVCNGTGCTSSKSPEILKRFMEIRGIGIVDVVTMFGAGAYRDRKNLRLVVELETWDENKYYDRLGLEEQKIKYFNTEITKVTIPVLPGRSVSLLVESAAMNEKLKLMGHFAAKEFTQKVDKKAESGGKHE